jgi:low temperature requirement protein LtrA
MAQREWPLNFFPISTDHRKQSDMDDEQRRAQAKQQVARNKGFYGHLSVYATVMALHALDVCGLGRAFGPAWEEKKIHEIVRR